jgi:hypothetical protein
MNLEPWLGELHVASNCQAGLALFVPKRPDLNSCQEVVNTPVEPALICSRPGPSA